jgi:hypothetical protein
VTICDHEPFDSQSRQHHVGAPDLKVHVAERPIENCCEQVLYDVLGDLFDRRVKQALLESFASPTSELRPCCLHPRQAMSV